MIELVYRGRRYVYSGKRFVPPFVSLRVLLRWAGWRRDLVVEGVEVEYEC